MTKDDLSITEGYAVVLRIFLVIDHGRSVSYYK